MALQRSQRQGERLPPGATAGKNGSDDPILYLDLEALGNARRQFASPLQAPQQRERGAPRAQRSGQQVAGRHRILNREVDADAADGRHRVGGVTDAQ